MTTKKDREAAVHVPQVERLAAYWTGKGADPIAADQIARAQRRVCFEHAFEPLTKEQSCIDK